MELRPLGHRIHIRPDSPVTQTTGGIIIAPAYNDQPPMSGTVIAVGNGPEHDIEVARRARAAAIRDCMAVTDEIGETFRHSSESQLIREELGRLLRCVPTWRSDDAVHEVNVGDRVIFPMDEGHEIVIGEDQQQSTVILNEESVLAVCESETQVA